MIRLATERFDPQVERQRLASTGAGALVEFTGLVRGSDGGEAVTALILHHHAGMTLASIEDIAARVSDRFDRTALAITHRIGRVPVGEPVVWVGAASRHRRAAFEAVDMAMDHLKSEALFWKEEERGAGAVWIEPTERDHADRARWAEPAR